MPDERANVHFFCIVAKLKFFKIRELNLAFHEWKMVMSQSFDDDDDRV